MPLFPFLRRLHFAARVPDSHGRLFITPAISIAGSFYVAALAAYLLRADSTIWVSNPPILSASVKIALGIGAPLSFVLAWRLSKPSRSFRWVYDWMGGGLICFIMVWSCTVLQDLTHSERLNQWGRFLLPLSSVVWAGLGIALMVVGTALLSDELRSERKERARLEALIDFTQHISSLDYQLVLDEAVRHLHALLRADAVVLFLWDEAQQVLVPSASYHNPQVYSETYVSTMLNFKCPSGYGLTGNVMATGQPYISGNVAEDPQSQAVPGHSEGEHSSLLAPLQVEGRRLGVVRLTRSGLHQFTEDDLDLVMSFASQAALVMEHGRIVRELSELSITDALTGLFNARHFHQVLDVEVRRAKRHEYKLSLVMIDSDSLKKVNDLMGHLRGDEHLRGIARAVSSSVRTTDFVFRYAGDEFLVLLPNTGPDEALVVAERVRSQVEERGIAEGLSATVSVGVASLPVHAAGGEALLAAADEAMYESKRRGKNRVSLACPPVSAQ